MPENKKNYQTTAQKCYRYFDLVMALFVTVLITSNIASSAKIIDLGFSIAGVPMACRVAVSLKTAVVW